MPQIQSKKIDPRTPTLRTRIGSLTIALYLLLLVLWNLSPAHAQEIKWVSLSSYPKQGPDCPRSYSAAEKLISVEATVPTLSCYEQRKLIQRNRQIRFYLRQAADFFGFLDDPNLRVGFFQRGPMHSHGSFFESSEATLLAFDIAQPVSSVEVFHEYLHFVRLKFVQKNDTPWINEGLSRWFEFTMTGEFPILSFEKLLRQNKTVSLNSPCFEFQKCNSNAIDEAYSSAALFIFYLAEHFGGNDFIKEWVQNPKPGFDSILNARKQRTTDANLVEIMNLKSLFTNFSIALTVNDRTAGYRRLWSLSARANAQVDGLRLAARPMVFRKQSESDTFATNEDLATYGLQSALFEIPLGPYCVSLPRHAGVIYIEIKGAPLRLQNEREQIKIVQDTLCADGEKKLLVVDLREGHPSKLSFSFIQKARAFGAY